MTTTLTTPDPTVARHSYLRAVQQIRPYVGPLWQIEIYGDPITDEREDHIDVLNEISANGYAVEASTTHGWFVGKDDYYYANAIIRTDETYYLAKIG